MALKLYYDFLSQPSRALFILLRSSNIPFEDCPVALRKAEHLTEEYEKNVSRFQKVPAIKDGNFALAESVAILRYLAKEKNLSNFYPEDRKIQARVDEYLEWQHNNLRATCSLFFRIKWINPIVFGTPSDPERVAKYQQYMSDNIDLFEKLWLENSPYIAGNTLTAADIWAACELEQPRIAGYNPEEGRPIFSKWFNSVRNGLNPVYQEAHAVLNKLAAKTAEKEKSVSSKL